MKDEEEIENLYRKYWECLIGKDEEGLRRLMTNDYYLLHMTGVKQSGEEFLQDLLRGTFRYDSAKHESIQATVRGNEATLIGKNRVVASVYGGGRSEWRLRGDFTLRKEENGWKFSSSRASTYRES